MEKNFRRLFIVVILMVAFSACVFAEGITEKQQVKVLEISMFEVGDNAGDFAGEFQHFYEKYFDGQSESYTIDGFPGTLYVNNDGVAGMVSGMGKAQAAASLTAVLSDPRFDFSKTFIIVSGCSGASPERATLGDVVIATSLVDYELGHAWTESDMPEGTTSRFLRSNGYDRSGYFQINEELVNQSKDIVKSIALEDCDDAIAYRALYGQGEEVKPSVRYGVSVTGDSYWHGKGSSEHADDVVAAYGDRNQYMVTQMEDNAFAVAAKDFGLENNLFVVRDVVNFDRPHEGQTVTESLDASSGAFSIGMINGFRVASALIDTVVANWE